MKEKKEKKLSPGQYWEWRCTIEEVQKAKLNEKRIHLEKEIMNKEIENRKLKLALFQETVKASRRSVEHAEKEYQKLIQRIELDLGIELKDCIIDEVTYEVRLANDENLTPPIEE